MIFCAAYDILCLETTTEPTLGVASGLLALMSCEVSIYLLNNCNVYAILWTETDSLTVSTLNCGAVMMGVSVLFFYVHRYCKQSVLQCLLIMLILLNILF